MTVADLQVVNIRRIRFGNSIKWFSVIVQSISRQLDIYWIFGIVCERQGVAGVAIRGKLADIHLITTKNRRARS